MTETIGRFFKRVSSGILILLTLTVPVLASQKQLAEGNRQFKNGHYDKALKLYEDALIDTPYSPILKYNAGAAAYMSQDPAKAARYFQEADEHAPPPLKSAAQYNRGNALYKDDRRQDAMEAYKQALRLNPGDEDARYNLSVLLSDPKGSPQNQKQKSKGGGGKDEKAKQDPNAKKDDPKPDDQSESKPQPKPGQMSKEDAERLIEAAAAGEMKKNDQKLPKADKGNADEDW